MSRKEPMKIGEWARLRVLGSGGFGVVTLWQNTHTSEFIALKKCHTGTDALLSEKHKERWAKEVEIMLRLSHPNIVKAITVPEAFLPLQSSSIPILCMEFCSKGDLRQILNRAENCCGLPESDVRAVINDAKSAIQYLHQNRITHRDLKPENIVLQVNDEKVSYKLIDLGYAKELDQSSLCSSFVGTLQYLAPELFTSKTYTSSVDYWSLGLLSHEVITGVRPFLPHMPPVSWMSHVKEKSTEHICVYQDRTGSIIFKANLFPENNISSNLKHHMEIWLRHILEWDPKKRGRNSSNKIVVFDLFDEIFKLKIITVYCASTYQRLSYEVNDDTNMITLCEWVEKDTGLKSNDQKWLLPDGNEVGMTKESAHYWHPIHPSNKTQENGVMLYVYRKSMLKMPDVTPKIPPFVINMLEDPQSKMEYQYQKRVWAQSVFFFKQEVKLYQTFVKANMVKLQHLILKNKQIVKMLENINIQLKQTQAIYMIYQEFLHVDLEYLKKYNLSVPQQWNQSNALIGNKLCKFSKEIELLQNRCDSSSANVINAQNIKTIPSTDLHLLDEYVEESLRVYDNLRRKAKNKHNLETTSNLEMVKILYKFLKIRDKVLQDKSFTVQLEVLETLQKDLDDVGTHVSMKEEKINQLYLEMKNYIIARKHNTWALAATLMNNESSTQLEDVTSIIKDNFDLRHLTMEVMNTSYTSFQSVVKDELDFSFLDK